MCGSDGCGETCGPGCTDGEVCSERQCSSEGCQGEEMDCDGECSTLLDDVRHCGNCRTACPTNADAGAVPVCIDAECYLTCRGHEDEPQSIDFEGDVTHCGRCGNVCEDARNGRPRCEGGECQSPCEGDYELCQGRCLWAESFASNCDGACCPVVRPGRQQGNALRDGETHAYTIEVDGPQHVVARLAFADGSCPGFESVFENVNEAVVVSINTGDDLGNRTVLSRGRRALGYGEDCVVSDAQVAGGAYEVIIRARQDLPAYTLTIDVSPAASAQAGARIDRTGVYPQAIPEDGEASFPVRLAAPQHMLVLGQANDMNAHFPEGCLRGALRLSTPENGLADDDSDCPVLDEVLDAGNYTLTGRATFGYADASFRAVVFLNPIGGPAARPLGEGSQIQGGGLDAFEKETFTFSLAAETEVQFQLVGDGCENAAFRVPELPWLQSGSNDPCAPLTQMVSPGDYALWVYGHNWNAVANWTIEATIGGGGGGGGRIDREGAYARPGFGQNGSDTFALHLDQGHQVTLSTSDGFGGCPGDTLLALLDSGDTLATDDDGGVDNCSRISEWLAAGDYTVVVSGYDGSAVPAYTLDVVFE